jgi:uncharacterized protein (TIGR04222 family)
MNPFNLPGPGFLGFYALFSLAVWLLAGWLIRKFEARARMGAEAARASIANDPYRIACLRGGPKAAIEVAIFSLCNRKLLKEHDSKTLETIAGADLRAAASNPLDKALMGLFLIPGDAGAAFTDATIAAEAKGINDELRALGLLTGTSREQIINGTTILLLLVAFIKIVVAISRGHFNVLFLILMAIGAAIVGNVILRIPRTALGDSVFSSLSKDAAIRNKRDYSLRQRNLPHLTDDSKHDALLDAALLGSSLSILASAYSGSSGSSGSGSGSDDTPVTYTSSCGGGGCGGGCGGCGGCS